MKVLAFELMLWTTVTGKTLVVKFYWPEERPLVKLLI